MYKINKQMSIEDFIFPYGKLKPSNRWVIMAGLIPWDDIERDYAEGFVNNGAPAHPARMALGSLIIKQILGCSDEELVCQVAENPYLQFFVGLKEFSEECPFGASTLVAFRKRFTEKDIASVNDLMLKRARDRADNDKDGDDEGGSSEKTMALDATVAPSDIAYPQDIKLLNDAREHLEAIIDFICGQTGSPKPRTYRKTARKDFLNWSKSKKPSTKKVRAALRKQLGYVGRDLRHMDALVGKLNPELTRRQLELLATITSLYAQQRYMYENKVHSVPDRVVSIAQPWVRPMVRGKTSANVEFGAKCEVSTDEGFARIEHTSFDAYNESEGLIPAVESYCIRNGFYPDRLLVDKIFRTRKNLAWCKDRDIRISGPRLGRPPKDDQATRKQKATEERDAADRNVVEGVFGTAKVVYGLDPVRARLEETTKTVIGLAILVFNLRKLLAASLSQSLGALISLLRDTIRHLLDWWQVAATNFQLVTE